MQLTPAEGKYENDEQNRVEVEGTVPAEPTTVAGLLAG
jgi:hypothetical protein